MTARARVVPCLAVALLVAPVLAACGVDTQDQPERIPSRGLPTELRSPTTEPTVAP